MSYWCIGLLQQVNSIILQLFKICKILHALYNILIDHIFDLTKLSHSVFTCLIKSDYNILKNNKPKDILWKIPNRLLEISLGLK